MTPGELGAVFAGKAKQRRDRYELALFQAWHTAVFTMQAKAGKLDPWSVIQEKFTGAPKVIAPVDWRTRKAERQAQMAQREKHERQRTRPFLKGAHGR